MVRKICITFCCFYFAFFCFISPAFGQSFFLSWSPNLPFFRFGQSTLLNWPFSDYYRNLVPIPPPSWPVYTPPLSMPAWPSQIPPLPWSWVMSGPFPGLGQLELYNWPQSNFFPTIGLYHSSGWPPYTKPQGAFVPMQITLIHIGDIHGHLIPRPHLRSDGDGLMRGGLARMYTKIQEIRNRHPNSLLINTGDTIQGSAEALYTQGTALVKILNQFRIDAFAPGNWDYLYGTERFHELFNYPDPIATWNALAANLYYDGDPYSMLTGKRVLQPYKIKYLNGLKIGILGFTAERGPMVVYSDIVKGFRFSRGDMEIAEFVPYLREIEKVDLIVMISELGLANNIRLAESHPGIDVILSSDMHEETWEPVITSTGTIVVEEGQDGTLVGELTVNVNRGRIGNWEFKQHIIDSRIPEHWDIATRIAQIRAPFVTGASFHIHVNPINNTVLKIPIDTVIGHAAIGLHRSNFSNEPLPAVVEGSSHDFLADSFRTIGQVDIGSIRGFRYGTHIAPGPIKLEDIYHYIPIGPFIARGEVTGIQIKTLIENNADGSLNPDVSLWGGGWLYGWSGLTFDLDPYAPIGERAQNILVQRWLTNLWEPLNPSAIYTHASYNYAREPFLVNKIPANNIQVLKGPDGLPLDATEVVAEYLKIQPANPQLNRIRIIRPLPPPRYRNPEIQPLWGAQP